MLFLALVTNATSVRGDTVFQLSLPLTSQAVTESVVAQHGGSLSGGQFGPNGWTTSTRGDYIDIPLPSKLDTSEGKLVASVANFEMSPPFNSHFWHFYLVVLDPFGSQTPKLPPWGHAHVGAGHRGYWDAGPDHAAVAYWNLFDPMCADWPLCSTETATGGNFISGAAKVTWTFEWSGTAVWVTFQSNSTVNKKMDLGATSMGVLSEDSLILSINTCGGSGSLLCGSWDEPNNRGGPIGVTYSDVKLEIYGTLNQGGSGGAGGGSGGLGAGGASTSSGKGGQTAGGSSPAGGSTSTTTDGSTATAGDNSGLSGDCSCRSAPGVPRPNRSAGWAALLVAALIGARRRRMPGPSLPIEGRQACVE